MTSSREPKESALRIQLLGGFDVSYGGRSVPERAWRVKKARRIVKVLALAPGHRMPVERLRELLWPEWGETQGTNFDNALSCARDALATIVPKDIDTSELISRRQTILTLEPLLPIHVDVEAFTAATAHAEKAQDPAAYEEAISLYTGELLPDDRYEDWATAQREQLCERYVAMLSSVAQLYEAQRDYTQAIARFQMVLQTDKVHEKVHVGLMRTYALAGERSRALAQYRQLREILRRELDTEPHPDSQQLHEEIQAGRFPAQRAAAGELANASGDPATGADRAGVAAEAGAVDSRSGSEVELNTVDGTQPVAPTPGPASTQQAQPGERPMTSRALRNRRTMLDRVHAFWIADVLEPSLHGAALIAPALKEEPDSVADPWELVIQREDAEPYPLPPHVRITQVYDEAGGELLILGEPGCGKTTLLLELARDLLRRARHDETHPMPVVLHLSSWAEKQESLARWMVEELNEKYQVPHSIGREWVQEHQVLPLLDGLDEVAPAARATCVSAINRYRHDHGLTPTVVCCRIKDYKAIATRIELRTAVSIQPLTDEQVDEYLASAGEHLAPLREALPHDAELRELASSPLMLSVMALAYHGHAVDELLAPEVGVTTTRRQRILATYVKQALFRRIAEPQYVPEQTISWLAWLARHLRERNQSMFAIEHLQPGWLATDVAQRIYRGTVAGLIYGFLMGLAWGLSYGLLDDELDWRTVLDYVLGIGVCAAVIMGAVCFVVRNRQLIGLVVGILSGVIGSILIEGGFQLDRRIFGWISRVERDPSLLTLPVLFGAIAVFAFTALGSFDTDIHSAEVVSWSWRRASRYCIRYVLWFVAPFVGLILFVAWSFGLIIRGHFNLYFFAVDYVLGLPVSSAELILLVLLFGVGVGMVGGLTYNTVPPDTHVRPNQGIWRSLQNGALTSLGIVCVFTVIGWLAFRLFDQYAISDVVPDSVMIASFVGFRMGWIACVQHLMLRTLLWREGRMPWNYARFLDYAAERILLRKAGGSYIFLHRTLLDHFAELEAPRTPPRKDVFTLASAGARVRQMAQATLRTMKATASQITQKNTASIAKKTLCRTEKTLSRLLRIR